MPPVPTLDDIRQAHARILPYATRTPVLRCASIDQMVGAELYFKCENLQKVGAFKFRGACNTVMSLSDADAARGVATHSSGNHGAALALAARLRGIAACVVMPEDAAAPKKAAVKSYGARIQYCGTQPGERERALARIVAESGMTLVHPFDDYRVIAGQGTAALELVEDVADLDAILCPVGGGGLISGTALSIAGLDCTARVVGVEPRAADDAFQSFKAGRLVAQHRPLTIADGLRTGLGTLTFPIIQSGVSDIVTVTETAIVRAMRTVWERMKIIIEPSSAVTLAALLDDEISLTGQRVGILVTGGNVDLDNLPWSRTKHRERH